MGFLGDSIESIRSLQIRQVLTQIVSLGPLSSHLIITFPFLFVLGEVFKRFQKYKIAS